MFAHAEMFVYVHVWLCASVFVHACARVRLSHGFHQEDRRLLRSCVPRRSLPEFETGHPFVNGASSDSSFLTPGAAFVVAEKCVQASILQLDLGEKERLLMSFHGPAPLGRSARKSSHGLLSTLNVMYFKLSISFGIDYNRRSKRLQL